MSQDRNSGERPAVRPASGSSVMSIETGFNCNAYCAFCPQISYRDDNNPDVPLDLTTEQIRERIRYGAANGYKQIGFSGGEVTIRPDFVELVAEAKALGYELIGITTNGMMMGYPQYAWKLLHAGVNSVNISVFGHNAKLHDAMMRTPGSFDMAMKALDNIAAYSKRFKKRIDLMSMCIAAPQVIEHYPEHVRLMGEKGIRLHMLQPFLMTKGNTHIAKYYMSTYEKIEWALREATKVAQGHGGHVKLFNTPVCLFWDIETKLERQWKQLDVFRQHEESRPGESERQTPQGYFRVDACATCTERCNGFRAEYYPQDKLAAEVTESVRAHIAEFGGEELWLAGFEIMTEATIRTVLQNARALGARRIVLMTGAIGRAYHEQFERPVIELVDEVCFVPHPPNNTLYDVQDRHQSHGNLDDIEKAIETMRRAGVAPKLSASVIADEVHRSPEMIERLQRLGILHLYMVATMNRVDLRPFWERQEFLKPLMALQERGFSLALLRKNPTAAIDLAIIDPTSRFVRHYWASRAFDWIAWSVPLWAKEDELLGVLRPKPNTPLPILAAQ